jgi:S1-C subfamily serine protease
MTRCQQGLWRLFTSTAVIFTTTLVILFLSESTSLAQTTTVTERAKQSIVYISFYVTNNTTGAKSPVVGTGFVVTKNGYVLTASHLFRDWADQSASEKTKNEIRGTLHDKPGYVPESPLILQIVDVGDPDAQDVALLKLPDPPGPGYPTAPICWAEARSPKIGDDLIAFGFPMDTNFQPVKGTLGTQNAPGGRWAAASAFTQGMSGGPVYSARGYVIGMVKGGLEGTDAVRWITPIGFAKSFLIPPFEE